MDEDQSGKVQKQDKWEVTWLFVGLLLVIVLSLIGWYIEGKGGFAR